MVTGLRLSLTGPRLGGGVLVLARMGDAEVQRTSVPTGCCATPSGCFATPSGCFAKCIAPSRYADIDFDTVLGLG